MDSKFQTSFIPKKALTPSSVVSHGGAMSALMVIAVILFIASLGSAGFVVGWKYYVLRAREEAKVVLVKNQQQFNPTLIDTLTKADAKISLAKNFIAQHMAVSEIFDIVSRLTAENIRFKSFNFTAPSSAKDGIKVSMSGVGTSYSAIAFQSSVFGNSIEYGSNKIIKNPILSDLSSEVGGAVGFTFTAYINPDDLSYAKVYKATLESEGLNATSTQN